MRELRSLGSVRGVSGNRYSYRDPRPQAAVQKRKLSGLAKARKLTLPTDNSCRKFCEYFTSAM